MPVAALLPLALLSILTACGGSGKHAGPGRIVAGPGYTYTVPAGWKVIHTQQSTTAAGGGSVVSVTVFSLRQPYAPALFARAAAELNRVAARLVADSHGRLTESITTTLAGQKARAYRYSTPAYEARVGFVLSGRHEYELFCRDAKDPACALLFTSFALG